MVNGDPDSNLVNDEGILEDSQGIAHLPSHFCHLTSDICHLTSAISHLSPNICHLTSVIYAPSCACCMASTDALMMVFNTAVSISARRLM